MEQATHTTINWMDRDQIVASLEAVGIACYDKESDDELREALRQNVMDGTIAAEDLPDAAPSASDRAISRSLR